MIALAWLRTKVIQRCLRSIGRLGASACNVKPSAAKSECQSSTGVRQRSVLHARSDLFVAISTISFRSWTGTQGRPLGRDFHSQKRQEPVRCQRLDVSGLTADQGIPPIKPCGQSDECESDRIGGTSWLVFTFDKRPSCRAEISLRQQLQQWASGQSHINVHASKKTLKMVRIRGRPRPHHWTLLPLLSADLHRCTNLLRGTV